MQPEVQYARIESAAVAYQVVGEGPLDLVFLPEWVNNLEMQWQDPGSPGSPPASRRSVGW